MDSTETVKWSVFQRQNLGASGGSRFYGAAESLYLFDQANIKVYLTDSVELIHLCVFKCHASTHWGGLLGVFFK
jgi:hypothetical protein